MRGEGLKFSIISFSSIFSRSGAVGSECTMGPGMELHRRIAHAGSSGPVDPAGSAACRGWCSGKVRADRTAEEVEYRKTNPTQANLDCHKPYCGIALNSFGAPVGSKNEANGRGRFLHGAGCLCRDRPRDPKSIESASTGTCSLPYAPSELVRDGGRDRGHCDFGPLGPDNPFFNGERRQRQIDCAMETIRIDRKSSVC